MSEIKIAVLAADAREERTVTTGGGHGHATGLVLLAAAAAEVGKGDRALVCATGVPPFLQAEAVLVSRDPVA